MNVVTALAEDQTILLLVPGTQYNPLTENIAKQLSGKKVAYISLNKTFPAIKEEFEKLKINITNFLFVDAISKTIRQVEDSPQCIYVSSPAALTKIAIAISEMLAKGVDYLIFDSLTNLIIYQEKAPVAKFLSNTTTKIKTTKTKALFYALSIKEQDALIQEASMFVDRVIDLRAV